MVSSTSGAGFSSNLASLGTTASTTLNQDQFLNLLVAQLRYQSPLNPLQPHEFASQLASFSSVEQLNNVNAALANQTQSIDLSAILAKATFGTSLVGRTVVASGDQVQISADGEGEIDVHLSGAGQGTLKLYNEDGDLVATRDLGGLDAGRQKIDLPDDLPEGVYTYKLDVEAEDGSSVDVETFVTGVVDGVQFENGEIVLRMGEFKVPVDSVVEIMAAEDDGASGAPESDAAEEESKSLAPGLARTLGILRSGPLSLL